MRFYWKIKIDTQELQDKIDHINNDYDKRYRTIDSCSGHNKYPMTIMVLDLQNKPKILFEWFSKVVFNEFVAERTKRNKNKARDFVSKTIRDQIYQKDKNWVPYIPEVLEFYKIPVIRRK